MVLCFGVGSLLNDFVEFMWDIREVFLYIVYLSLYIYMGQSLGHLPPPWYPPHHRGGESSLCGSLLKKLRLGHFLAKSRGEPFGGSQNQITTSTTTTTTTTTNPILLLLQLLLRLNPNHPTPRHRGGVP